jgi:hypothetical protein
MKISFSQYGGAWIHEDGEYDLPVESTLPHRFELVDGKVVDKYNGVTDDEVKLKDHEDAVKAALNAVDHEDKPAPLTPPPPLGWVAPEDHVNGENVPVATLKNLVWEA